MGDVRRHAGSGFVLAGKESYRLTIEPSQPCQLDRLDLALAILDIGERGARNLEIGGHLFLLQAKIFARFAQPIPEAPPLLVVAVRP